MSAANQRLTTSSPNEPPRVVNEIRALRECTAGRGAAPPA